MKAKICAAKDKFSTESSTREQLAHREILEIHSQTRSATSGMGVRMECAPDDGQARGIVANADVPDLWMKHMRLSVNLELLRNTWHDVKQKHTTSHLQPSH